MGMIFGLATLGDPAIARVLADPPLIWRVLAPDDPEAYLQALAPSAPRGGLLGWLLPSPPAPDPAEVPDLDLGEGEGEEADLDKAWHALHFLLTGSAWEGAWPANFLVRGGTEVGDIDVGYGPARVLTATETREVADHLRGLDAATLRERYDPAALEAAEIYPSIWAHDPEDEGLLDYVLENFEVLEDFVRRAAEAGLGLVLWIC